MILASQSPRRSQLLQEAGYEFRTVVSSFDERTVVDSDPIELVRTLARGKAAAVAPQAHPGEPVIGSDTIVVLDGAILGKPADATDARHMLRRLSGHEHTVATAVSVYQDSNEVCSFVETARVEFWDLSDGEIESYVASGEPFDKAGAYGIQGKGRMFVKGIAGDYYTIVGFPISRLARELARLGITPRQA